MSTWKKTKVSQFLFEREGKYKPTDPEIVGLKRIEKIDFQGNFHIAYKPSMTNMILVNSGDLIISGINVSKGALGVYEGKEPVTATIHYSSYTYDEKQIHVEYLKRFLKSPKFVELLKEQVRGGIKTEIKPKHILALEIALPSLSQQEVIVDLFKRIETEYRELKVELSYQKTLLKKFREQVLQDAIEGKLTAGWREDNSEIESAARLLERILADKKQLLGSNKIKKQKVLPPIAKEDIPFELPEQWEWCRLDHVIYQSPRNGYSPKTVDFETNTRTLKLGATTKGVFDPAECKYIDEEIDQNSHIWLKKGDILIQRSNSLDHVGIAAVYTGEDGAFIYPDIMMKIRASSRISNAYLHRVLTSPYCRGYFRSSAKGAQKSMPKINQGIVSSTLIPLPPAIEQEEIIRSIDSIFTISCCLEEQITQNQIHTDKLLEAMLKEAFTQSMKSKNTVRVVEMKAPNSTQVDYYKRTLLAAEIVSQLHQEPTLGHLKLQKLIFLCQKTQRMQLPTNFLQQAAGPYDPKMARSVDKQLKDKEWFEYKRNVSRKYHPLENAGTHKPDFEKYFSTELTGIARIISLFRKARSEEMEAVATLFACWEEILKSNCEFTNDLLIQMFYAWSNEKKKFSKEQLDKYIGWMIDHSICPTTVAR